MTEFVAGTSLAVNRRRRAREGPCVPVLASSLDDRDATGALGHFALHCCRSEATAEGGQPAGPDPGHDAAGAASR